MFTQCIGARHTSTTLILRLILYHELLVKRLECKFGIVGQPLEWIKSYLTGRSFSVISIMQSEMSSTVKLVCSVPQGSVLGPLLFILYIHI